MVVLVKFLAVEIIFLEIISIRSEYLKPVTVCKLLEFDRNTWNDITVQTGVLLLLLIIIIIKI